MKALFASLLMFCMETVAYANPHPYDAKNEAHVFKVKVEKVEKKVRKKKVEQKIKPRVAFKFPGATCVTLRAAEQLGFLLSRGAEEKLAIRFLNRGVKKGNFVCARDESLRITSFALIRTYQQSVDHEIWLTEIQTKFGKRYGVQRLYTGKPEQ